jgi:hypothetical protein
MELVASIISIKTPNFDSMRKFFKDLEFDVRDTDESPFCPLFGERGVSVHLTDSTQVNLEEDTSMLANTSFNITLFGFALAKLMRLQERVGAVREEGFMDVYYTFTTPDGGKVVISTE